MVVDWDEMVGTVLNRSSDPMDIVVPVRDIQFPQWGNSTSHYLTIKSEATDDYDDMEWNFNYSNTAISQLLRRIMFPEKFWYHLRHHDLMAERNRVANELLSHDGGNVMARAYDQTIYGICSPSYERINNEWILQMLGKHGVPERFDCRHFRHDGYPDSMVLKFTSKVENVGDYGIGFTISNSENGLHAFRMSIYIFVLECSNGMIMYKGDVGQNLRHIHKGIERPVGYLDPPSYERRKFFDIEASVVANLDAAEDAIMLERVTDTIEKAKKLTYGLDVTVQHIVDQLKLTVAEKKAYMLSIVEQPQSLWGVVQALTSVAHTELNIAGTPRQEELEAKAWEIIS